MNGGTPKQSGPGADAVPAAADPGATEPAAAEASAAEATLHRYELTIWERAEHWRFYEVVQAVSEADARARFRRSYGKGYRLQHVHSLG